MPEDCLIADQLRQGLLGLLPHKEQARFERHILQCQTCQQRLDRSRCQDSFIKAIRNGAGYRGPADHETTAEAVTWSLASARSESQPAGDRSLEFAGNERFRIDRRLGAGGMGIVYQAFDRQRRESVALKTLRRMGSRAALRLTQEFRALADLRHRNLVSLYELYADGETRFFTMELLEGCDFLGHVRGPDPSNADDTACFGRLRSVLPQLVAGLTSLHDAGKIHRDIKPSNVLVTRQGRLVLVDFGIAVEASAEVGLAGDVAGTAAYMSPEQAAGRRVREASDWYSVGVMLFQALTGELPFRGPPLEVMARKQTQEPLPLDYWARHLPDDLQTMCADLLRPRPEDRPAGGEIAARLGAAELASSHQPNCPTFVRPTAGPNACFVGRKAELRTLSDALRTVIAGHAAIVAVSGPSGVGKTALANEFLREVNDAQTAVVLGGRCYERELVPYKAADSFMESLADYLRTRPPAEVEPWCSPELGAAAQIFPVLRRCAALRTASAEAPPTNDLLDVKRQALAALRALLRRMTAQRPIVFFIDDLQWGDADSPWLFAQWLRGPSAPRILLVAAFRGEAAAASPWLKAWQELERKSGFAWARYDLALGPLSAGDARELAGRLSNAHRGGSEIDAEIAARQAMGHPLFLRELIEQATAADAETPGPAGLPNLPDMVWRRIACLEADAYRLLEVVAVAGYPLSLARAHRAARLALAARGPLHALQSGDLARTLGDEHLGKIVVYHDAVRETLLSRASPNAIADAHRRLASAAAAEDPVDDQALVLHYQGAGEHDRAAQHAVSAADGAAAAAAFDSAVRCYRLALRCDLWKGEQVGVLREKLAGALANAGSHREAAEEYLRLAAAAQADEALRWTQRAGEELMRAASPAEALRVLAPVFRRYKLRPPPATRRRLLASILWRRAWLSLTGYRARRPGRRAIDRRAIERIDLCSRVGPALSFCDYLRGADLLLRGSQLALKAGEESRVSLALVQEACICGMSGRLRRAQAFLRRAETWARRANDNYVLGGVHCARAICHMASGQWRQTLEESHAMKERIRACPGKYQELVQAQFNSNYALFYSGQLRQLAECVSDYLQDAIDRHDTLGANLFFLNIANIAWLAADRSDEARRQIAEAMRPRSTAPFQMSHYFALASHARIDLYLGQGIDAWRRVREEWPQLARSGLLQMPMMAIEAHYLRAKCALAAIRQRPGDRGALGCLRRSVRFLKRQPWGWSKALAALARAGMLETRGDRQGGIAAYHAARELLIKADMPLYAEAADRRLGELTGDEQRVAQADAAMSERGVSNPPRMARLLTG